MNLEKKRDLASRALNVGRNRILFNNERLAEIKEAITKNDIRDLVSSGAILIREQKGRKTIVRRSLRRRAGSVRMKVSKGKTEYVRRVRKLRAYMRELAKQGIITKEQLTTLRKEVKASHVKNKTQLKERASALKGVLHA